MNELHPLTPSLCSNNTSSTGSPASSMPPSPPLSSVDEVTTIFVVGFPEDMQEREFQNMFVFSKGFEAASLKWHSRDPHEESYVTASNNKKQMIGFARFKSRQEAIDAAKEMNGKRVDIDKNVVLKAEMAKKNLHIKRNSIAPATTLPSAVPLPDPFISRRKQPLDSIAFVLPQPTYESFLPLPSDLLSPTDYNNKDVFLNDPFMSSFSDFTRPNSIIDYGSSTFSIFSKSSNSSSSDHETDSSYSTRRPVAVEDTPRKLSLQQLQAAATIRPVDQNPPCNTLYVGNLPVFTNEEELRCLFSGCEGYKRMCFRQKLQGPMCFVEFEDIVYATQAMIRHQGHVLSNSVKGGLRLSFSKNPLFIKPNKEAEISFGFKQLGTTLLADVTS